MGWGGKRSNVCSGMNLVCGGGYGCIIGFHRTKDAKRIKREGAGPNKNEFCGGRSGGGKGGNTISLNL